MEFELPEHLRLIEEKHEAREALRKSNEPLLYCPGCPVDGDTTLLKMRKNHEMTCEVCGWTYEFVNGKFVRLKEYTSNVSKSRRFTKK